MKDKKQKKTGTKKDYGSMLALFAGLAVAFLLYYLTEVTLIFPLAVVIALLIYYAFTSGKKDENIRHAIKERIRFYEMFLRYSSLESSFQIGFRKAVENLPISDLKDKLTDYLESKDNLPPLELTKTREESELISCITKDLKSEEEFTQESLMILKECTDSFIKENREDTKIDYMSLCSIILFFLYFLSIVFSLTAYEE